MGVEYDLFEWRRPSFGGRWKRSCDLLYSEVMLCSQMMMMSWYSELMVIGGGEVDSVLLENKWEDSCGGLGEVYLSKYGG